MPVVKIFWTVNCFKYFYSSIINVKTFVFIVELKNFREINFLKLYKGGINISIYNFLATDFKLPISNNSEENIQSVNDLVKLGYNKKDIHINYGNILEGIGIDDDEKFFLFDSNQKENKLEIYEDNHNRFARYYSQKKYIYRIENRNSEFLSRMMIDFLNNIKTDCKEIELWHTWLDKYELDEVEYGKIDYSNLTVDKLDTFFEMDTYLNPKLMSICKYQNRKLWFAIFQKYKNSIYKYPQLFNTLSG